MDYLNKLRFNTEICIKTLRQNQNWTILNVFSFTTFLGFKKGDWDNTCCGNLQPACSAQLSICID